MRVRKHAKKITQLEEYILKNGPMDYVEIKEWLNERIRGGVTSNWLGNVLVKCGLFEKIQVIRVPGTVRSYTVGVYDSRRRNQE